ncbi:MAG: T9SS type A sorting domain-containing protein [Bacteroidales bacterium]|nr:T9SS type A sorting domain-containing protein [Bacteroidales bacterium]
MKKKISITLTVVFIGFSLFGQGFISPEKQWNVRLVGFPGAFSTEIFKIAGDSTIDTISYSKIWASYDSLETWSFQGLLRENAKVVYFLPPQAGEGILYDFNLEIGDTAYVINAFCTDAEVPIYVTDIDTVEYFGVSRKRWHLGENGIADEYWVEGIGSLNGPLYTKYWYCIVCPVWELLCYHQNDELLFRFPGEIECYQNTVGIEESFGKNNISIKPNPVKKGNSIEILADIYPKRIDIYNPSGVLIKSLTPMPGQPFNIETNDLSPGLYILTITSRDGKTQSCKILVE